MQKETSSSQKIARKAAKIYRKEMKKEAEEMGRLLGNALKPKPDYVPLWLWMWGLKIFIKTKPSKRV